ncbi:acyltransferase family protein [Chitinimonas sp. PSY-7]|uniref:acyltransferase family protein n=1 Tax=Chitinimonas sp. PSY-7 TaxID=3459088 RepID=UPI00403FF471
MPSDANHSHEAPTLPRNDAIDLLRGLSILLVVIHQLALPFRLPLGSGWLGDVLPKRFINGISFSGYESVFVFFVISGFVITRSVLERDGSLSNLCWRSFYTRRVTRILPLLLLLLVVLTIMHLLGVPQFVVDAPGQSLAAALMSALTMTLNWYEGRTGWLPGAWDVLWSLSIEESFYLAFPIFCLLLRAPWRVTGLWVLALSLPWAHAALRGNEIWQEKAYLPGMAAIAWGVLTALLVQRWSMPRRTARMLAVLAMVGLSATFFYADVLWRLIQEYAMLLLCLSPAAWLAASSGVTRTAPRGTRWLTHLGRWSYEIYLSHMFIVLAITGAYLAVSGNDLRWACLVYVPAIAVCALVGWWLHRYVSGPAAQWMSQRMPSKRQTTTYQGWMRCN